MLLDDAGEALRGRAPGVTDGVMRKLQRGRFPFRKQLDLHGQQRERARAAVEAFIAASRRGDERCVLIVTGRGAGSRDNLGVLREALPGWLSTWPNRAHVIAFCAARRQDGGPGAFYVLLKHATASPGGAQT
jgi:DNA-nicking Smr family endonuclease